MLPAIDEDAELQRFVGKSGRDIRAFIEANLLEDAPGQNGRAHGSVFGLRPRNRAGLESAEAWSTSESSLPITGQW